MEEEDNILGVLIGGVALAGIFYGLSKYNDRKTKERKSIPVIFPNGFNEEVFSELCVSSARTIKRLKIEELNNLEIKCSVKSSSGLSTWYFTGDFNDYGNVTGKYWIYSDNVDSTVPRIFMNNIVEGIRELILHHSVFPPHSSEELVGRHVKDVKSLFIRSGFKNISLINCKKPIYFFYRNNGSVSKLKINGIEFFEEKTIFNTEAYVEIYFYDL